VASLDHARHLVGLESGLATVATVRRDGTVQLTVVNAGITPHPVRGEDTAAFVARGGTRKIVHLRRQPRAALLWRAGWAWVAVEGPVELCGPDDPMQGVDGDGTRRLLRDIAQAAGVQQEDWDEYDRLVAAERRTAVLISPQRVYRNP
jgi:PPOX class probable F420-dependent enzyme